MNGRDDNGSVLAPVEHAAVGPNNLADDVGNRDAERRYHSG